MSFVDTWIYKDSVRLSRPGKWKVVLGANFFLVKMNKVGMLPQILITFYTLFWTIIRGEGGWNFWNEYTYLENISWSSVKYCFGHKWANDFKCYQILCSCHLWYVNVYQAKNKCTILHHTLEKQGDVLIRKKVAKVRTKK